MILKKGTLMKTKKTFIFFCTLCLLSMLFILPVSAKSKTAPKKLTLSRKEITLYAGESKGLLVEKVRPANASSKVTWTVKNKKIASVSKKGQVTAKKAGRTLVYATSQKNPDITATVRVTVRKKPKKVEKTCTALGKAFFNDSLGSLFHTAPVSSCMYLPGKSVIRNREDFLELKKAIKALNARKIAPNYKQCCLKEYENMDFSQESLVLLDYLTFMTSSEHQFISCTTKFDSSGKLCGTVKIACKSLSYGDGYAVPTIMDDNTIALRMNKREEAMIDYFKVEIVYEPDTP